MPPCILAKPVSRPTAKGFTLIELIVVMIVVGIMAVVALPRFGDNSIFEARGFLDETKALLRYAQKTAIAQRRVVCVAFTATRASLTVGATSACGTDLTGPNGVAPYSILARSGGYSPTPANFSFDATGQPSVGQTITVTGGGTVTVEAATGYVH